ncbi:hypothetical protein [Saccharothrix hoggarensis]|uniref:Uncharacterized protein n=1 Tax=Saccharothrix hoggarensis TaxID=913853 RepID=A0ABW3QRU9_9PSEU
MSTYASSSGALITPSRSVARPACAPAASSRVTAGASGAASGFARVVR